MSQYKAILIDPFERKLSWVELQNDNIDCLHKVMRCDVFTVGTYLDNKGTCLYVDDEGLFKNEQAYFVILGIDNVFAGRSLVVGTDEMGGSITPTVSIDVLESKVRWMEPREE